MTRIQTSSPPIAQSDQSMRNAEPPQRDSAQPAVSSANGTPEQSSNGAGKAPGSQGETAQPGLIARTSARLQKLASKVEEPYNAGKRVYKRAKLPVRAYDLAGKVSKDPPKDQSAGDAVAQTTETTSSAVALAADTASEFIPAKGTVPAPPKPSAAALEPSKSPFVRGDKFRVPMRLKPSLPHVSAPHNSLPGSPTPTAVKLSVLGETIGQIGKAAGVAGGGAGIYFGVKEYQKETEPAGKAQGSLHAAEGAVAVGAGVAGIAEGLEVAGAAAAGTALTGVGIVLVGITYSMSKIPAVHGRDNNNRAIKLHNDVGHEVKQMNEADKHLSGRANNLKPSLDDLQDRYGVKPKNVWLNNNAADFLNQVNSPNNTTSGQWKKDSEGNVWSNFRDKYISINGTPHADEVTLDLPAEKDGSKNIPASKDTVTIPGDTTPDKHPTVINSLAAEPERYDQEGWTGSTGQAPVSKQYGYKTSSWGQNWETNIPFAVNAGPSYVSHAVAKDGQDSVVLIDDTSIGRPEKRVPHNGYIEGTTFANDGHDGERLTEEQIATLKFNRKPVTTADGKFNVADSADKQDEDYYREAAYPNKDGVSYIRSPDPFTRVIKTNPENRTVVSLQNVDNPTQLTLHNQRDIVDVPRQPNGNVSISLPPLPANTADERRLGMADQQAKPTFKEQSVQPGEGGKNAVYVSTYTFANGSTLTVQGSDPASIKRFMGGTA